MLGVESPYLAAGHFLSLYQLMVTRYVVLLTLLLGGLRPASVVAQVPWMQSPLYAQYLIRSTNYDDVNTALIAAVEQGKWPTNTARWLAMEQSAVDRAGGSVLNAEFFTAHQYGSYKNGRNYFVWFEQENRTFYMLIVTNCRNVSPSARSRLGCFLAIDNILIDDGRPQPGALSRTEAKAAVKRFKEKALPLIVAFIK